MVSTRYNGLYSFELSQEVGLVCRVRGNERPSWFGVAGDCNGDDLTKAGDEGWDLLRIMKFSGIALWLGDFIDVSCRLLRMFLIDLSLDIRSGSGVSGGLSGNSGNSSIKSSLGEPGLLGGNGRRSPYCGSIDGLNCRSVISGSWISCGRGELGERLGRWLDCSSSASLLLFPLAAFDC